LGWNLPTDRGGTHAHMLYLRPPSPTQGRATKLSNEQSSAPSAHIVIRIVADRGLHQNVKNAPEETVHQTAAETAQRLMAISDEGPIEIEIEINGDSVEPELIGYWRMLAREALNYPGEFDQLVRSISRDIP
jgi:hypothetical protein